MQKFLKTGLVFLFCLVLITGCGIPKPETPVTSDGYTVTDHEGNTVYIPHKPKRIITAQLAFDTILLGIVPADHLVAVNVLSKDPMGSFIAGEVKNIRYTIPPGGQISTGLIMKTKPDLLILTDYIDKNTVEMIRSLGYPVVICHSPDSHQDIIDAIKLISESVGYPEKGEKLINKMKSDLTEIEEKMKEIHTEPPVGLLVSQMQSYGGPGSMYDANLTFAHIRNGIEKAGLKNGEYLSKDPMGSFIAGEVKNIRYTIPPGGQISTGLIMKTKPDLLILTDYIDKNTVEMIRSLGYPVVICHSPDSHQDIIDAIKLISESVGYPEKGEKLINKVKSDLTEIEEKMKESHTEPPVGLLVSQMQSYGGPGSMYDANLTFAHIRNGIEKAGLKNGEYLSKEMVLKSDPDFFLVAADRPVDTRKTNKYKREFLADPVVQTMKGRHNVVAVPSRYIYCGNQNCGWAIKALANAAYGPVYGELFDISDEHFIRADDL